MPTIEKDLATVEECRPMSARNAKPFLEARTRIRAALAELAELRERNNELLDAYRSTYAKRAEAERSRPPGKGE